MKNFNQSTIDNMTLEEKVQYGLLPHIEADNTELGICVEKVV